MRTLLYGDVVLPDRVLREGAVLIDGGRILDVDQRSRLSAAHATNVEHDGWIAPGFVDLHVHGGAGADFMDGSLQAFHDATLCHARHGTTAIVPTTTVADHPTTLRMLDAAGEFMQRIPNHCRVLGVHLYGPYFAPTAVGCHPTTGLRSPIDREYEDYFDRRTIVSATIAPELEGTEAFARRCREEGIVVHLGHSHGTFEQVERAVGWGARHVDHLFCAMSDRARLRQALPFPMRGGLMEATLYFDELTTEVIADGRHLAPSLLRLALKLKGPDRLALATDASRAVDMPDGEYVFGPIESGERFRKEEGVGVTLDGTGLASSVSGMDHMVRTFHEATGCPLEVAIRAASLTPARIVGRDRELGSVEPGKWADLVLLDRRLRVRQVWLGGRPIGLAPVLDPPDRPAGR